MDQFILTDVTKTITAAIGIWGLTVLALSIAKLFTENKYARANKEIKTNLETYWRGLAVLGISVMVVVMCFFVGYVASSLANWLFDVSESAVLWSIATLMLPYFLGKSLQRKENV